MTLTGKVKRLIIDKGFGFIEADGAEYFFHQSAAGLDWPSLQEGTPVTFEPHPEAPKGPRAESVRRDVARELRSL